MAVVKILIDMPVHRPLLEKLRGLGDIEVRVVKVPEKRCRPLPNRLIRDIEILGCYCPPKNLSEMTRLRWVQITSSGYNQLAGLDLVKRGIRVANARGSSDIQIAEWNIAMMVNLVRDLRQMIRNQDRHIWDNSARFQQEIRGLTAGVWGYGGIGRETARLAKAMGMAVHVLSREGVRPAKGRYFVPGTGDPKGKMPDRVFLRGQEPEFLSGLDFLILALPLTPETEGIVGERELRALPRTAYLLNPARGPLVKEQALLKALRRGWIAGAALDTHFQYPMPPNHPLWRMPNVIMTPHISGLSKHYVPRFWDIFIKNVERDLHGQPLINELTSEQLSAC